jgi:hypothetical protein
MSSILRRKIVDVESQVLTAVQCRVVWSKFTNVSEAFAASIIRAIIALIMEAASTTETPVNFGLTTRSYNPVNSHLVMVDDFFYCLSH